MNKGFTLVELLAATALAAALMAGVLAVTASLGRGEKTRGAHDPRPAWRDEAAEMLAWDLRNAEDVRWGKDRLELRGYGSLDPATLVATQRSVRVTYSLRRVGEAWWLYRAQSPRDASAQERPWSEPICGGVAGFDATFIGGESPTPAEAKAPGAATAPTWQTARWPQRVRIVLRPADPAVLPLTRTLYLR